MSVWPIALFPLSLSTTTVVLPRRLGLEVAPASPTGAPCPITLRAAKGSAHRRIAKEHHCLAPTVLLWRQRFHGAGVAGLERGAP